MDNFAYVKATAPAAAKAALILGIWAPTGSTARVHYYEDPVLAATAHAVAAGWAAEVAGMDPATLASNYGDEVLVDAHLVAL